MEKPDNCFAIANIWEKHLEKKEILRKGPAPLLNISLWDDFQFLLVQTWFLRKRNIDRKLVIANNNELKRLTGSSKRLH